MAMTIAMEMAMAIVKQMLLLLLLLLLPMVVMVEDAVMVDADIKHPTYETLNVSVIYLITIIRLQHLQ